LAFSSTRGLSLIAIFTDSKISMGLFFAAYLVITLS
jgi:hypothetical protein